MLEIKNLKASINNKDILKGLNITIKPGELHAIMGPNGSGKSTLANVLSGKNGYEISGELKYQGKNLKEISIDERVKIVQKAIFNDLKFKRKNIKIITFNSLTTDLCKKYKSNIILRGLRAVSDFEYEFQLAGMNRKLNNKIETIFLMSDLENQIISSRFVKEIAQHKGDLKKFTTKSTIESLNKIYV